MRFKKGDRVAVQIKDSWHSNAKRFVQSKSVHIVSQVIYEDKVVLENATWHFPVEAVRHFGIPEPNISDYYRAITEGGQ